MGKQLSSEDTQDTIRVACVLTTKELAGLFTPDENRAHTIGVIVEASRDRSWRVRLTVAKNFDSLCDKFGPELINSHLLDCLKELLKDHEQEVRKEAILMLKECKKITNDQLLKDIIPLFQNLGVDPADPVRAALATVLGPIAERLGREVTQRNLLPQISDLMKDESHLPRLEMVNHAGLICEVLGFDGLVHSLLHTIQSLIMDNHWRIRQSVVEQVPKLAGFFGVEMFQTKLEQIFISSLRDSVSSVRQAAIQSVEPICKTLGDKWTADHLLPKMVDNYSASAGYANRVTCLHVLPKVAMVLSADKVISSVIPTFIKATKYSVPNVRFTACRTLFDMLKLHTSLASQGGQLDAVKTALKELQHDSDIDVQYYAARALAEIS